MGKKYDAIIIGSGIGGLTCGTLLQKNGANTVIVEQHARPGGYVTSYTKKGFVFDFPHVIGGLKKGGYIDRIFSYLGLDKKVELIEVDPLFKIIYPDITFDWHVDINRYKEELIKNFPREEKSLHRYFKTKGVVWKQAMAGYYQPNLLQFLSYPFRFPAMVKYPFKTFKLFADGFFKDERLKEILAGGWRFMGMPASRISAVSLINMYMSYHTGGVWYIKGGWGVLADVFSQTFKEYGGTMLLGKKVTRILVDKRKAVGVECADGTVLEAKYIVSDADTKQTLLHLLGPQVLSSGFLARVREAKQSVSGFSVHLGVKMDLPHELRCGCIMYYPDYGNSERMFGMCERGEVEMNPDKMDLMISIPSLLDPGLAPRGCHIVEIIYMPAPCSWQPVLEGGKDDYYQDFKHKIGESLIAATEKVIPGISQNIVVEDILTPMTYARFMGATSGSWYDLASTPDQVYVKKLTQKIPIKGLYFAGAKGFLGSGVFPSISDGLHAADYFLGGKLTKGRLALPST